MHHPLPTEHSFLLILHGPLCGGKSTLARSMADTYADLFRASTDAVKWQVSSYASVQYKRLISEMMLEMVDTALGGGLSVVGEGLGVDTYPDLTDEYYVRARRHGAVVAEINVEAPYDVLVERFKERVDSAEAEGRKLTVTTVEEMKKRYDYYQRHKSSERPTLNSHELGTTEMVEYVVSEVLAG